MTQEEYKKANQFIIEKLGINSSEVFDIDGSPIADEFLRAYKFYSANLVSQCGRYNIAPSCFFFQHQNYKKCIRWNI